MVNYPNSFDDNSTLPPISANSPSGPAGGDLSGTYPDPTVTDLSISSSTLGSILYFDGTNWVQLPPGSEGQVLTAHGAAPPTWENP